MVLNPASILQAASFTLGCFTIHTLRHRAHDVTQVLTILAVCLGLVAAIAGIGMGLLDVGRDTTPPADLSQAI